MIAAIVTYELVLMQFDSPENQCRWVFLIKLNFIQFFSIVI